MRAADEHAGAELLRNIILDFVDHSPENTLGFDSSERVFDEPLVGFAGGADALWEDYRSHIGAFYLTPLDFFREAFPGVEAVPGDLAVVSWILPSTKATRREQARERRYPSERWVRTRYYGELFNNALRRHVVERLTQQGIEAVAPLLSPRWSRSEDGPYAPCSTWSERHAAYAAGLGTFGLCDGLITPVGKAHRTGSVIAKLRIAPSPRPAGDHHGACLHFTHDSCRKCIARCPVKALSADGHDKGRCMEYTERTMNRYIKNTYGIDTYACGLCQCGVPCMDHIPDPAEG